MYNCLKYAIIFFLLSTSSGFPQAIFSNTITGTNPNLSNPYTNGQTHHSNITVSGIGRGSGINGANANNRYSADGWQYLGVSLNPNEYFEFTLTPNNCNEINFTSFEFHVQSNSSFGLTGPTTIAIRSSLDGYTTNIGGLSYTISTFGTPEHYNIDLSSTAYQNIESAITFRIYGWGSILSGGTLSINDFTFNGSVSPLTTTWSGGVWSDGLPSLGKHVIINDDYDTSVGGNESSFSACSLTINNGDLIIADDDYVEVENDLTVNVGSSITVQPYGAFIQNNDAGSVSSNGNITVIKRTAYLNSWYEYTYWSSPVSSETIATALEESQPGRRYIFNAAQFNDAYAETNNNNILVTGQDGIDDEGNDWQSVGSSTPMVPGVGYAAMHGQSGFPPLFPPPYQFDYTFEGPFNNGIINVPVYRNDISSLDFNWNFIGNPYPSAIDIDAFMTQNMYPAGPLEGAVYFWSQYTDPSPTANGNEPLNFSTSDYAIYNVGVGGVQGGDPTIPNGFIPSGQAFFVSFSDSYPSNSSNVVFNNAMRSLLLSPDNSQFFKNSKPKATSNRLWLNLTSGKNIFNQTLIGYVDGATDGDDGSNYDTRKIVSPKTSISLYSIIENSDHKFAIQGKNNTSLGIDEMIPLGFKTSIEEPRTFKLSIAQLEGDFFDNNPIYLKDNLLNTVHNLSESDYTFTSEIGEFNDRFVVMFNKSSLSVDDNNLDSSTLRIVDLDNNNLQFMVPTNLKIKNVSIFDLLGREIYKFSGQNSSETYTVPELKNTIYIAKVTLSNGELITKKALKK